MEFVVICSNLMEAIVTNDSVMRTVLRIPDAGTVFGPFDLDEANEQKARHDSECEAIHVILHMERG